MGAMSPNSVEHPDLAAAGLRLVLPARPGHFDRLDDAFVELDPHQFFLRPLPDRAVEALDDLGGPLAGCFNLGCKLKDLRIVGDHLQELHRRQDTGEDVVEVVADAG